ncbi:MAG TPA: tyrosine--tRNA ligase [Candidatus Pacearchaeota archaeon]|nr:tyrosine--tRNA ligase [Candidatus Pacearchaeota archaeon]HOK93941.1 tyrosine--tRNA ligase [Candidatus Pacearchaeota archaeon]HPO75012.1 tyrosine--tRNA ligase [Candidatus Pacearchaeota archaeon]
MNININTNSQKINEVLTRRVAEVLPDKGKLADLLKKRRIKLYLGIDPTAPRLHLGHTITLRKLQEFADLGHEAILVIGTGTVLAGDPSLRDEARKKISEEEIKENIKSWKKQAGKVLDFSKVKIKYNGDWLLKLTLKDIIEIASHISAVKLFQRDMFQRRLERGDTVFMHETLYPLLQGYDSVHLGVDLEIGGTDQTFNMLIGRELEEKMVGKEKFILTCPMIMGIDGKQMSKSSGNCVWLEDSADEMFGKIMSIPDNLIFDYFKLLTNVPSEEIEKLEKDFKGKKVNPKNLKTRLAREIVTLYHDKEKAVKAEKEFNRIFKEKELPSKMPLFIAPRESYSVLEFLVQLNLARSKSEAKRLIEEGGVKIIKRTVDNKKLITQLKDWKGEIQIDSNEMIIQVGKRKFAKVIQS